MASWKQRRPRSAGGRPRQRRTTKRSSRRRARSSWPTPPPPSRRWPSGRGAASGGLSSGKEGKKELRRPLCGRGKEIYIAGVGRPLASGHEPWDAYVEYLRRIVAASTHGLTVRLAGTFTPTAEMMTMAERMRALSAELFDRVRGTGTLRPDITFLDIDYMLEFLADVKLAGAERTAELRQRHLSIIIDGLRCEQPTPLPGAPPTWEEQTERWVHR